MGGGTQIGVMRPRSTQDCPEPLKLGRGKGGLFSRDFCTGNMALQVPGLLELQENTFLLFETTIMVTCYSSPRRTHPSSRDLASLVFQPRLVRAEAIRGGVSMLLEARAPASRKRASSSFNCKAI